MFGISTTPNNPELLHEFYYFQFQHSAQADRGQLYCHSGASSRAIAATCKTVVRRLLILLNAMESLPDAKTLVMRLYFNSKLSGEYYSPSFGTTDESREPCYTIASSAVNVLLGYVCTPFYSFGLRVYSVDDDGDGDDNEDMQANTPSIPITQLLAERDMSIKAAVYHTLTMEFPKVERVVAVTGDACETKPSSLIGSILAGCHGAEHCSCDCGVYIPDGVMLECIRCQRVCHAGCHGVNPTEMQGARQTFLCFSCILEDRDRLVHLDSGLVPSKLSQLALWRRCLTKLEGRETINYRTFRKLVGCTIKDGRLMFDRLISESVVEPLNPHSKAGSQKVYKLNWGQKTRNLVAQSFDKDLGKSIKVLDVRQTSKGQPDELQGSRKRSLAPSAVSIDHHGSGSGGKRANKEA